MELKIVALSLPSHGHVLCHHLARCIVEMAEGLQLPSEQLLKCAA